MKKTKQTKAEKIADLIGHDIFLRAEAYYYERNHHYVNGYHVGISFIERLEKYGANALYNGFAWNRTLEGYEYWLNVYDLIKKWERNEKPR